MIYLTDRLARHILSELEGGRTSVELSPDLGFSGRRVRLDFAAGPPDAALTPGFLAYVAGLDERVFRVEGGRASAVETAGPPYVKLVPTAGAPTIYIDGIQMHRTAGIDPAGDTDNKVRDTVRRGDRVLDTCAGLGYTAIRARKAGAALVLSIERSPAVLEILRQNPWSRDWLDDPGILRVNGDSSELVDGLADGAFDAVLHDPPRFSLAGELYSERFYAGLARILKRGGRLFHYVGKPDSGYGAKMFPSVLKRLKKVGFDARVEPARFGIAGRVS